MKSMASESRKPIAKNPTIQVKAPELSSPNFGLYPYQKDWIKDTSQLKIACKSRRIGYSFAADFRAFRSCLEYKHNVIVLSKKEELAKEFISEAVAPHVRAAGVIANFCGGVMPGSSIKKQEVQFSNGSRIIALTSNPDSARSYEGDVILDEFGFHQDARKVYEAIEPSITRGYNLEVISTPNGQQEEFYRLARAAGLVDGIRDPNCQWSAHKTDIHEAVKQGCCDRYGKPLDVTKIRSGCLDEEMWLQEYCCMFLSIGSQWISPELFRKNVSAEASSEPPPPNSTNLYCGWDVARSRDLSVLWFLEMVGDVSWTRGVVCWHNIPTPEQISMARPFMPMVRRMSIDTGSMGLTIFELLQKEFPSKVEGVQFSLSNKEAMAVYAKRRMEEGNVRIPDDDIIRYSFSAVKRSVNAVGNSRFDAAHDQQYGHADHWWAFAMAEMSAQTTPQGDMSGVGVGIGRPIMAGIM